MYKGYRHDHGMQRFGLENLAIKGDSVSYHLVCSNSIYTLPVVLVGVLHVPSLTLIFVQIYLHEICFKSDDIYESHDRFFAFFCSMSN